MSNRVMLKVAASAIVVIVMYVIAYVTREAAWMATPFYIDWDAMLWIMFAIATIVNLLLLLAIWWNRETAEV